MPNLLELLIAYYVARRYANRTYGVANDGRNAGLEQMRRVREIARKARQRREK